MSDAPPPTPDRGFSDDDLAACLRVLRALGDRPALCAPGTPLADEVRQQASRFLHLLKAHEKEQRKRRDHALLQETGIRRQRAAQAFAAETGSGPRALPAPAPAEANANRLASAPELSEPQRCYVCKRNYTRLHFFYDSLCPSCGDFNFAKRNQTADLRGRVFLLTGGRVKIGFQVGLRLLRAGARLVATTRFPRDAAARYAAEADFPDWRDRLGLYPLDLRLPSAIDRFADYILARYDRLDGIINNAAQTVRRPPAFYRHLLDAELAAGPLPGDAHRLIADSSFVRGPLSVVGRPHSAVAPRLPEAIADHWPEVPALLSQLPAPRHDESDAHFPAGRLDGNGQQVDLRPQNSWTLKLGEVSLTELLEVHAVNAFAPFLLLTRLGPLLLAHPERPKYVVNVSAMEGQFNCPFKTGCHPHTNMAKAALNMLTRTAAGPYAKQNVYMNSVDTGWVTNEFPAEKTDRMRREGFEPPLDELDGAARVCDPIFHGANTGEQLFGLFLKDYRAVEW